MFNAVRAFPGSAISAVHRSGHTADHRVQIGSALFSMIARIAHILVLLWYRVYRVQQLKKASRGTDYMLCTVASATARYFIVPFWDQKASSIVGFF